jgi:hypothetical protein
MKINPSQFKKRTWFVCAGNDEWGTSGSAWFLANKWGTLLFKTMKWYDPFFLFTKQPFLAVLEITPGQDESATLLKIYKTSAELESEADYLESIPEF